MPSTMTHTYFCLDVYNKLPKNLRKKFTNLEYLKMFSQGSDPLMFYSFFIGKKAKYHNNNQYLFHTTKTQDFFINLINYINDNKLYNNYEVLSYLYGNICHYFLDLWTHPFIIYKTGRFDKNNKNTYKYNCLHQEMEYVIDMYFISIRENIPPNRFRVYKYIYGNNKFSSEVRECIDCVIYDTYGVKNFSSDYIRSFREMKLFFRMFNYDRLGIKKNFYSLFDKITPSYMVKLRELSFSNNYRKKLDYLNLDNKKWCHPCNKDYVYNYSFVDLYEMAIKDAVSSIVKINKMFECKNINQKELKKIFKNLSYTTGMNCNKDLTFKYFEF